MAVCGRIVLAASRPDAEVGGNPEKWVDSIRADKFLGKRTVAGRRSERSTALVGCDGKWGSGREKVWVILKEDLPATPPHAVRCSPFISGQNAT